MQNQDTGKAFFQHLLRCGHAMLKLFNPALLRFYLSSTSLRGIVKRFVIFGGLALLFMAEAKADMLKCVIKKVPMVTNYFDSNNEKERKKCVLPPELVVTSSGEKIQNTYKNSPPPKPVVAPEPVVSSQTSASLLTAAKDVVPLGCAGSGGTVRINGRVFHIDPDALCKKYGRSGKGTIARGTINTRHIKLSHVDQDFRRKIAPYVNETARKYQMEPEFIHAIISAESAYKPNATSRVGAMGLMQLMPFTAKRFGVSNAYNPYQNIEAGTRYLKLLFDEFGSLELAAAGYNAGEGAVRKYNRAIPPYKETRAYVPKVMAYYREYKKNRHLIGH